MVRPGLWWTSRHWSIASATHLKSTTHVNSHCSSFNVLSSEANMAIALRMAGLKTWCLQKPHISSGQKDSFSRFGIFHVMIRYEERDVHLLLPSFYPPTYLLDPAPSTHSFWSGEVKVHLR